MIWFGWTLVCFLFASLFCLCSPTLSLCTVYCVRLALHIHSGYPPSLLSLLFPSLILSLYSTRSLVSYLLHCIIHLIFLCNSLSFAIHLISIYLLHLFCIFLIIFISQLFPSLISSIHFDLFLFTLLISLALLLLSLFVINNHLFISHNFRSSFIANHIIIFAHCFINIYIIFNLFLFILLLINL